MKPRAETKALDNGWCIASPQYLRSFRVSRHSMLVEHRPSAASRDLALTTCTCMLTANVAKETSFRAVCRLICLDHGAISRPRFAGSALRGSRFYAKTLRVGNLVDGVVAQLVERLVRNEKVRGSIPLDSTILQFNPSKGSVSRVVHGARRAAGLGRAKW
jgi:hypothetical protein